MSSQEEKFALVAANEAARMSDLSAGKINDVTKEIKSTILFQYRWEELLMAAPVAINCLGGCFVASSSPIASTTIIPTFQYKVTEFTGSSPETRTSSESLQAGLVECSNLGRFAFLEAEKGMGRISTMASRMVMADCQAVIECLNSPPNAKKFLALRMNQLKKAAVDCHETAQLMDRKFEEWLLYICKFYVSCVEQQSKTESQRQQNELDLKTEEIKEKASKDNVTLMKEQSENFKSQVKEAREDYRKAMDSFPQGWDVLLGDLASGYINTMGSAMNAVAAVGSGYLQTTSGAGAIGAIGSTLGGANQGLSNAQQSGQVNLQGVAQILAAQALGAAGQTAMNAGQSMTGGAQQGTWGGLGQSLVGNLISSAGQTVVGVADPAYVQLNNVMVYLNILKSIVNGKDGGIDWTQVAPDSDGKSGLSFAYTMLASIQQSFQPPSPIGESSAKLITILNTVAQVAKSIRDASSKPAKLDKADPIVKKWQDEFNIQYNIAYQMQADGRKLPGNPANTIPMMGGLQQGAQKTLETIQKGVEGAKEGAQQSPGGSKKGAGQAMVDNARAKTDAANSALKEANKKLMESNKMLAEQQKALAEVQANLAKLQTAKITLEEVKAVLVQSIALIMKMKAQVEKLVKFFSAVATTVDVAVKTAVEPFMEEVSIIVGGSLENVNEHYSLDDFTRTSIFHGVMTIRAYFSVFTDVAKMWVQLSHKHIMPGLQIAEEVGMSAQKIDPKNEDSRFRRDMAEKMNKLKWWVDGAKAGIEQMAKTTQGKIEAEMHARVEEMAKTTTLLLPSPEEVRAIEQAKAEGRPAPATIGTLDDDI
ncbi:hypothetical protein TWF225_012050 [Orbilia oligospora]|nr:hypothetical protein TWF225_012050 [Orbilia oligospora]KAF3236478.1 hypothetical protein TWF128_001346 [Orbilia oligospora]KAF3266133.1 hypothetical protein TWF217_001817 [Orbilia oligospora]